MQLFKLMEDKLVRIDSVIVELRDGGVLERHHQQVVHAIEDKLQEENLVNRINMIREETLSRLNKLTTDNVLKMFGNGRSKEKRVYLRWNNTITPQLLLGLFDSLLGYNYEPGLFKKLQYYHLYPNVVHEISMMELGVSFDSLTDKNRFKETSNFKLYCLSSQPRRKYLVKDTDNVRLVVTDGKFNAIKSIDFEPDCSLMELGIVSSPDRILLVVLDSRTNLYQIYSFDFELNVIKRRKLSTHGPVYFDFSSQCIFYKLVQNSFYSILDADLTLVAKLAHSRLNSASMLRLASRDRAIVQNNLSREIKIVGLSDEDDQVHFTIKLESKSYCRRAFFDLSLNLFIIVIESDGTWLKCYDPLGEFQFKRQLNLFEQYSHFELQNDRIYFYDNQAVKKVL